MQQMNLWDEALPFLEGLVRDTGETGHLAVLDGGEAIYIERVEARRALRVPSAIGRGYPAHATNLGKVLLADLPPRAGGRDHRRARPGGLHAQHDHRPRRARGRARAHPRRGYAIDDEEYDEGLRCIGARRARPLAARSSSALGIGGPVTRITPERVEELAALVMTAARGLSRRLGAHQSGAYASATLRVRDDRVREPALRPARA